MKHITIGFSNFWGHSGGFTAEYFYTMFPFLRQGYELEVVQHDHPDVMFYSVYGYVQKQAPDSIRVLIAGEAGDHFAEGGKMAPGICDPSFYHYALTCALENTSPNHFFLPQPYIMLNLYNNGWQSLIRDGSKPPAKTKFCDFIYSNGQSQDRIMFQRELAKYKTISCAGAVDRNCNDLVGTGYDRGGYLAKQAFQSQHKFSMAFENNYFPGYTSEKLSDPLVARSVPIYHGDPAVNEIFNPAAIINVGQCSSWAEAIDWIKIVDQDNKLYERYLNEPPFIDNKIPERFSDEALLDFFNKIFA
jgi:hypothetical protein